MNKSNVLKVLKKEAPNFIVITGELDLTLLAEEIIDNLNISEEDEQTVFDLASSLVDSNCRLI